MGIDDAADAVPQLDAATSRPPDDARVEIHGREVVLAAGPRAVLGGAQDRDRGRLEGT